MRFSVAPSSEALAANQMPAWAALACSAVALPTFLAFNPPPSATFLNQALSLIGWGLWLTVMLGAVPNALAPRRPNPPLVALIAALGMVGLAALASPLWAGLPWTLSLSSAGAILAAMLAALAGSALQRAGAAYPAFRAFSIALVVAGIGGSLIGLVQFYVPQWADGDWIARTAMDGRAVGNLRQPNHLSSLLLWGVIAVVWLGHARVVRRGTAAGLALLFVFVVVLTGSRTGALGTLLLAGWGVLDRRLAPAMRRVLWLAPVAYAVVWWGNAAWADYSHHVFGGETRFGTGGDVSSSRFGIWSNTLTLIRMHPWAGVGFGELNFAWSLTAFPGRPTAFFDHTHNLVLQFVVELGIPLGLAVTALLCAALVAALRSAIAAGARDDADGTTGAPDAEAPLRRAAFVVVLMIVLHSLLEYPLWYAYFLLPTAFALGLGLGVRPTRAAPVADTPKRTRPLLLASLALTVGGLLSVADYLRVVEIFSPAETAAPLGERIVDGRRSVLFGHHADYAAATTVEPPSQVLPAFRRAPHYLLDARLMMAWAKALAGSGDVDRARWVAARLKEFRNAQTADFFAECDEARPPGEAQPFQCEPPKRDYRYEDFR